MSAGRLSLRGAWAVLEPPRTTRPTVPGLAAYQHDLLRSFGQEPVPGAVERPSVSHSELVDRLVDEEAGGLDAPEADLALVAYALPDVHPFRTTATHLSWRLGNRAASFAVSEQGLAAPFTALRIAAAYGAAGRCRQAVLAVLEQSTLADPDPLVADGALVDSGALLLLDTNLRIGAAPETARSAGRRGPGTDIDVREVWTCTEPADCAGRLSAVAAAGEPTLLVEGPWAVEHGAAAADVHGLTSRTYCTSVWLALAEHPDWTERYGAVILHDTDPRSGRCAAAVLRSGAGHPAGRPAPAPPEAAGTR